MIPNDSPRHVAARDSLELQLVQIWEELLGQRPIGVDQDFFKIGGDSVLAMSLLARIVQETGHTLPANGIFGASTIEKLAAALRAGIDPADWSPLVAIQPEGSTIPFFCVHPGGGNVLCYLRLSQRLGPDQRFFGLQAPGVDGIRQPLTTIEEMAEQYLAAIRKAFPHGPYAMGGWSVGGVVVFEMAQRLLADGEEVCLLAILDSGVLYSCALMTSLFAKGGLGVLDLLRQPSAEQLAGFRLRSAAARLIPDDADDKLATRIFHLFVGNMRAVVNYRPEHYPGRIDLFEASEPIVPQRFSPRREWSRLCDQLRVHDVPGSHLTMVHEPHVARLADLLRSHLDGQRNTTAEDAVIAEP
jgi:thioesterase domain-containing protein